MQAIQIANSGPEITETNYWDGAHSRAGFYFLSWNAGVARLLVPDVRAGDLRDMRTAQYVIVSRGPWPEQDGREGLELLFEDGSDAPFCLHLSAEQCDRLLPDADQGAGFSVVAWTRSGKFASWPGKYRKVTRIPCLEPWSQH